MAYCRESRKLASFKRPRIVCFVDSLPSNPSGKIVLPELRRLAAGLAPSSSSASRRTG